MRTMQIRIHVEWTYSAHSLVVLDFVLTLEKSLEFLLDKGNTLGAPLIYFVLLSFSCPTCGNGFVSQFSFSTDERSEGIEQRSQRVQAIHSVSVQDNGTVKSTDIISGWCCKKNGVNTGDEVTLGKCYLVRVSA